MELKKNSFPIKISKKKALEIINHHYKDQGYDIQQRLEDIYLNIVPYWFCFYDIYYKKDKEYKTISGQSALNALTNDIEEQYTQLFEYSNPKHIKKVNIESLEKTTVKIKKQVVSLKESEKTIQRILSAKFEVDLDKINLSGFDEVWIPFWKLRIDNNKEIKLDAVCGKINNLNIIEQREKTDQEIYKEMLREVQNPKKLFSYLAYSFGNLFSIIKNIFLFFKNHKILSIIIIIIVLIILLFI